MGLCQTRNSFQTEGRGVQKEVVKEHEAFDRGESHSLDVGMRGLGVEDIHSRKRRLDQL